MKLNNSIKLLMANFSLFWKILLYKLMALGVVVLLFIPLAGGIDKALASSGFYSRLESFINLSIFKNPSALLSSLFVCLDALLKGFGIFAGTSVIGFIYLLLLVFVIAPFIFKFSDVPTSESVYSYMSSLNKNAFTVNFVDAFWKSAGYSILKTLMEIPFWAFVIFGGYGILWLSTFGLWLQILCPFLFFVFVILVIDLKISLFAGWVPSIVAFNICPGKAFNKGAVAVKRKFLSTLSSFAVVAVVFVAVVYLFGIYSLIVALPLMSLLVAVFGQVLFFESQGMNYYLTPDKIVMPRKLERADNIYKVRHII